MHIHENRPGVLTAMNKIFAEQGVNIAAQYLQTSAQMGYVVIDIEADEDVAQSAAGNESDSGYHSRPSAVLIFFKINGQVTYLPVFFIPSPHRAVLRIYYCESSPENKSKSDQCVVFI